MSDTAKKTIFKNIFLMSSIYSISNGLFIPEVAALMTMEVANEEKTKAVNEVQTKLTKANTDLTNTKSQLTKANTDLTNTKSQLTKANTDLTNTKNQLTKANTDLTNTKSQLTKANTDLTNTKSQLTKANTDLTNTKNQLTTANTELTNTKNQLTTANNKASTNQKNLQTQIDTLKKEKTNLTNQLNTTKSNLDKVTKEKNSLTTELNTTKKNLENTTKNLNNTINKLRSDLKTKETELANVKKTLSNYEAQIKKLNLQIEQKTKELNDQIKAYKDLQNSVSKAEITSFAEKDTLTTNLVKAKSDLEKLLARFKEVEADRVNYILALQRNSEIEKAHFRGIIAESQELELKYMNDINELKSRIETLEQEKSTIIATAQNVQNNLIQKINQLTIQQKNYLNIINGYKEAEAENMQRISSLESKLNIALRKNDSLVAVAKNIHYQQLRDEKADESAETAQLMKIDDLNSELNTAHYKNNLLLNGYMQTNAELQKTKLELNKTSKNLENLSKKYDHSKGWSKQAQKIDARKVKGLFLEETVGLGSQEVQPRTFKQQNRGGFYQHGMSSPQQQGTFNQQGVLQQPQGVMSQGRGGFYQQGVSLPQQQPGISSGAELLQNYQTSKTETDKLVDLAVDSIFNAMQNIADNNTEKTNASMNIIGIDHKLPKKVNAIIKVVKKRFNDDVLNRSFEKISERYKSRQNFIDETMKHVYGDQGGSLIDWTMIPKN